MKYKILRHIPNVLSFSRIVIGIIAGVFLSCQQDKIALSLFIVAALTDSLDGAIARKYNFTSTIGEALDPIADKMIFYCMMLFIILNMTINAYTPEVYWYVGIFLGFLFRDFWINYIRIIAVENDFHNIAPYFISKIKTFLQFISIVCLVIFGNNCFIIGLLLIALLIAVYTSSHYTYNVLRFKNVKN